MSNHDASGNRPDGRRLDQIRPVSIETGFQRNAEGSASIRTGNTWVICSASVEDRQPAFLRGTRNGWVTAEYSMLPRSVGSRLPRSQGQKRASEIQRLIGRSLRAIIDLEGVGEHTITIDCDVIDADGGTRTAALTGAFVALCDACRWMVRNGRIFRFPIIEQVAAVGVGIVAGEVRCDLSYDEDSTADVDFNVVMTGSGDYVGLNGAAEGATFSADELNAMLASARGGLSGLFAAQRGALGLSPEGPFAEVIRGE
jgi:ribonuclease PH